MSDSKVKIKLLAKEDYLPEELHWPHGPCQHGIELIVDGKFLSFGFFDSKDFIENLMEGLTKLKAAIERGKSTEKEDNMNAKGKLVGKIQSILNATTRFKPENKEVAETLADSIIEAVKEELGSPGAYIGIHEAWFPPEKPCGHCTPADHGKIILVDKLGKGAKCVKCGKEVPYPAPEPDLIQGYTAEQWQEIIGGGYLCEFSMVPFDTNGHIRMGMLFRFCNESGFKQREQLPFEYWGFCRPAQIKGVMKPIFVEPVDKGATCVFFGMDSDGEMFVTGSDFYFNGKATAKAYIEL